MALRAAALIEIPHSLLELLSLLICSEPLCQAAGRTKRSKKRRLAPGRLVAQSRRRFAPICFLFRFAQGREAEC
ncbi:Hypothetical predicted protein, partial [Marmota monax]